MWVAGLRWGWGRAGGPNSKSVPLGFTQPKLVGSCKHNLETLVCYERAGTKHAPGSSRLSLGLFAFVFWMPGALPGLYLCQEQLLPAWRRWQSPLWADLVGQGSGEDRQAGHLLNQAPVYPSAAPNQSEAGSQSPKTP